MKANTRLLLQSLTATGIFTLIFLSCSKESSSSSASSSDNEAAIALSASSGAADNLYNDAFDVALQTSVSSSVLNASAPPPIGPGGPVLNGTQGTDTIPSCATVTISPMDTATYPKTVTVDFGAGCKGWYGVTRSGSITYVFSGKYKTPGTTISASFNNYRVNGFKLEGTYSIKNNSSPQNGISFTTSVVNGKLTYPDGTTWYSYSGTRTFTQTAGFGSPNLSDYVFSIAGSHSCAASDGRTLTDSITTPLTKAFSCKYISAGIVGFTYNNLIKGTFDYGNGNCDSLATITVGTLSRVVSLPR